MAEKVTKFSFFESFYDAASDLDDGSRLALYDAICAYAFEGVEPDFKGVMSTIWKLVKPNIDSSVNGQKTGGKGGRPNTKKPPSKPPVSKDENPPLDKSETTLETDMDMDMDKDMDREMDMEVEEFVPLERTNSSTDCASASSAAAKAAPPPRKGKGKRPVCPMCDTPTWKDNLGYHHCPNCHDQFTRDKVAWAC